MFWNFLVLCIFVSLLQQAVLFMTFAFKASIIVLLILILLCVWVKR